jgi:hypothetical protein
MFKHFNKNGDCFYCACTALAVIVLSFSSCAQTRLSYKYIVDALDTRLPEAELITQIENQKLDFALKSSDSVKLVLRGASDLLMQTIIAHRKIDKLPITFNGWKPFGDIAIAPWNNNAIVLCKGSSGACPGLTTYKTFDVGDRSTLVIKMEEIQASTFTNQNKMLKVFASELNKTLECSTDSLLAPDDREFVIKKEGEFRYRIPESLIIAGQLQKLGIQFGPGEYKTFKVSAWFE